MKKSFLLFGLRREQLRINFDYQYRDWRIVGAVVVIAFDYQVLMGIKIFQPVKDLIPLFKSGIATTVDTKRNHPPFFRRVKA